MDKADDTQVRELFRVTHKLNLTLGYSSNPMTAS